MIAVQAGGSPTRKLTGRQRFALVVVPPPVLAGVVVTVSVVRAQMAMPSSLRVCIVALCVWPVLWAIGRSMTSVSRLCRTSFVTMALGSVILAMTSYAAAFVGAYLAAWAWLIVVDEQVRLVSVALITVGTALLKMTLLVWKRLSEPRGSWV